MSVAVGDRAETRRTVTEQLLEHFAEATGDRNPIHFDEAYAASTRFGSGQVSAAIGSTLVRSRSLKSPRVYRANASLRWG